MVPSIITSFPKKNVTPQPEGIGGGWGGKPSKTTPRPSLSVEAEHLQKSWEEVIELS
jgi:hypothetical protein